MEDQTTPSTTPPSDQDAKATEEASPNTPEGQYVVVARRYRPQSFEGLIGQSQVTQALENAIKTNRVGHAYLFTGARGVGKTSAARILAKALNCVQGPTPHPCQVCDICQSIAGGNDVDVMEIDGASNRGIEEIRQLRSSIGVRPGRSRFKVYIIDEVHMLTKEAFNALLKTLEEPPEHVKFVFCTTDPEKIPITVLSRCQRFDFAPIETSAIVARLREIVTSEGARSDEAALELLARKAGGSMRDSQSLLEQLLAFGGDKITTDSVHTMLGTADATAVGQLVDALARRDSAQALQQLDECIAQGVDVGQLAEQVLGYLRDTMAAGVGGGPELLRSVPASEHQRLIELSQQWGLASLMAALQLIDQALVRMRQVLHRRTLVELALVRICELEQLEAIQASIQALNRGDSSQAASESKKKTDTPVLAYAAAPTNGAGTTGGEGQHNALPLTPPAVVANQTSPELPTVELSSQTATRVWQNAVSTLEGLDANLGRQYKRVELDGKKLIICFDSPLNVQRFQQEQKSKALRTAVEQQVGSAVDLEIRLEQNANPTRTVAKRKSGMELVRESYNHPFVREAIDLFEASVSHVQESESQAKK